MVQRWNPKNGATKRMDYNLAWIPIAPGDSEIWIETEKEREDRIEQERRIEYPEEYIEEDIENETDKENA